MITIDGEVLSVTRFPDNTTQVWKLPEAVLSKMYVRVSWHYTEIGEFFELAQLKSLLERYYVRSTLYIDYLPFARQDKYVNNDACFALFPFADALNALKFHRVDILDPHSSIALDVIHNALPIYPTGLVEQAMERSRSTKIVYPDQGALDKYYKFYAWPSVRAQKVRDPLNGEIISLKLAGSVKHERVMVVDDICDGGATFVRLARELYKSGASEVSLFVTHGIFSKGLHGLRDAGINHIWTAKGKAYFSEGQVYYR